MDGATPFRLCFIVLLFISGSIASQCKRQIDLGFVIDRSASIGEENFNSIKQFVKDVIEQFVISQDNTRVGVIPFSHYYKIAIKLNEFADYSDLSKAIDSLEYEGAGSSLASALKISQLELFNEVNGGRNGPGVDASKNDENSVFQALVVITDGGSSTGIDALLNSAQKLKDSGKRVFVVGLGKYEYIKNLEMMASEPIKKHCFNVKNGKDLPTIIKKLTKRICKDIQPVMKTFTVMENNKVLTTYTYQDGD